MSYTGLTVGVFLARRRYVDALIRAKKFVLSDQSPLQESKVGESFTEDLRQA